MAGHPPTGADVWDLSATQWGKRYRMGAEVAHDMWSLLHATALDCSELTEVVHAVLGVYLPDGSGAQADFLKKHRLPLAEASRIKGTLAGHYPTNGKPGHVVILEGDGIHTSEAMGRAYGVRRGTIAGRGFTWAALVPGVVYPSKTIAAPPPPKGSLAEVAQALFYCRQIQLGKPGVPLNPDAVKFAQAGLNRWFADFARMTGKPAPKPLAVNGVWGQETRNWVVLLQKITGINELGTCGPATWGALYP